MKKIVTEVILIETTLKVTNTYIYIYYNVIYKYDKIKNSDK